jgi:hypothetical protein
MPVSPVHVPVDHRTVHNHQAWSGLDPQLRRKVVAESTASLPAGRAGMEADFGDATVGILDSAHLTGQVIVVDGRKALLGN